MVDNNHKNDLYLNHGEYPSIFSLDFSVKSIKNAKQILLSWARGKRSEGKHNLQKEKHHGDLKKKKKNKYQDTLKEGNGSQHADQLWLNTGKRQGLVS